ncbi:unnamed protein product [Adineta ricciae]|uniref:Uncharacterized protein n=1 Tax=Adineta ricciae TaxID=249248 RepID=A0A815IXJ5_ADIRI|nr:unnamed protein product [Adineta ricciae]CAF1520516.1 unnamed protein product [Adineta ricciae]
MWFYQKVVDYNLFMLRENDYEDDDDDGGDNVQNSTIVIKHQKYKTWLYVILLTLCLYILFYVNLIKTEPKIIVIPDITFDLYKKLYDKHNEKLLCPCSKTIISYENITLNDVIIHEICSSIFVDPIWINGLYFHNASQYGVWDFRTTAYSQFEFLSSFCSLSNEIISKILNDSDQNELVSLHLLSEQEVQKQIDGRIKNLKNNAAFQIMTFLNYARNISDRHYFVSALNTNLIILTRCLRENYLIFQGYIIGILKGDNGAGLKCSDTTLMIDATLSSLPYDKLDEDNYRRADMSPMPNSSSVTGFFVACTPIEAILKSTLYCLYKVECLQLLLDYFPNLEKGNFNLSASVLSSEHEDITVEKYFNNLFIKNWSTQINYTKYFDLCSPLSCSHETTERAEIVYAVTLFISLYGGLVIILRLISSFSIDLIFKWKLCAKMRNENSSIEQRSIKLKFLQTVKRLNLFKDINDRTEQSIKHQKMVTCVYLILLIGSICIVCIFTSLNSEIITIPTPNASIITYLEISRSKTLHCPCSNKTILYGEFLTLSPRFHQICSSGFVHNSWISLLRKFYTSNYDEDWLSHSSRHFQFLSDFCSLAQETVEKSISRYRSQLFIVSSVMNQTDLEKQINASLEQFYQSTIFDIRLMINILQLFLQINQLYADSSKDLTINWIDDVKLTIDKMACNKDLNQPIKTYFRLNEMNLTMDKCICAINSSCQKPAIINERYSINGMLSNKNPFNQVPGEIQRCFVIDSLLSSSLQILYEDEDYFPFLLASIRDKISTISDPSLVYDFGPLIYDPTNQFSQNKSVSSIIFENLMIEQWNSNLSYELFYESCSPSYCNYFQRMRTKNFLGVIITLISMIGGIIISLRIVTPDLVKIIVALMRLLEKKRQQQQQQQRELGKFH